MQYIPVYLLIAVVSAVLAIRIMRPQKPQEHRVNPNDTASMIVVMKIMIRYALLKNEITVAQANVYERKLEALGSHPERKEFDVLFEELQSDMKESINR